MTFVVKMEVECVAKDAKTYEAAVVEAYQSVNSPIVHISKITEIKPSVNQDEEFVNMIDCFVKDPEKFIEQQGKKNGN